jgi:hypothetical protein
MLDGAGPGVALTRRRRELKPEIRVRRRGLFIRTAGGKRGVPSPPDLV